MKLDELKELKPCPFCGLSNKVEIREAYCKETKQYEVTCGRCFASVRSLTTKGAAKRWNRRPPAPV